MKLANNSKKGFTLIELVITIAVLAILATIAIPAVVSVLHASRESVDLANANELEYAIKTYIARKESNTDSAVTYGNTVYDALNDVGVDTPLICKQPGYNFYYNSTMQEVICADSNNASPDGYQILTEQTSANVPLRGDN